jgi:hypothetical protein
MYSNIPFSGITDIDSVKFINIEFDHLYPVVITTNANNHTSYNTLWYVKISLSKILQIYNYLGKALPEHLVFDQKTINYINRFNLEDNNEVVYNATRLLSTL